jgi:ABC-2 type transport system ATP-binding protein
MNDAAVITTHDLTRQFGGKTAVDRLNIEVQAGEIFGFLGHNGAGKTTTVRLLNGVLTPDSGSARLLGLDPQNDGPELRKHTGVLTETPSLDERLVGRENLTIYAELYGVPKERVAARVNDLLESFELTESASLKVGGYSKGMKQRLALARAFLHEPELLFLDEPTAGLDPVAARQVHELILRLSRQEGRTVFLCTHNLVEAQKLCHRVGVMEHGRLAAVGTPAELAKRFVRRLNVEIEIDPSQIEKARHVLQGIGVEVAAGSDQSGGLLTVTAVGRDAIPAMLDVLVRKRVRVYRLSPQESDLEEVYFALHDDQEANQ